MPQPSKHGGSRLAVPPKKPSSPLKKAGKILYILLVILSAIIVGGYAAAHLFIQKPEIKDPGLPTLPEASAPAVSPDQSGETQQPHEEEPEHSWSGSA